MSDALDELFDRQGGVATGAQLLGVLSRRKLQTALAYGSVERLWHGIYSRAEPDRRLLLRGLDLACGTSVPICLGTAAAEFGFDTEDPPDLHVLSPDGSRLRSADGLVVHRRDGAPLIEIRGRPATAPAWTAVEVSRALRGGRALATLDAALRSGHCIRDELVCAARAQAGRRGIVEVRRLIPLANPLAESPMESEARLVMLDGGLPEPQLQYEIRDGNGDLRRFDFAWPQAKVAAEYEGVDWHSGADEMRRDRRKLAAVQDVGWVSVPILLEDVRYRPAGLVARLDQHLRRRAAA
ncbi:hypothetical protein ACWDUN_25505 [Mycobacterium sp. NPDC003323]